MQQVKIPEGNTDYTGRGLWISRRVSWKKELSKIELNLHWLQQLEKFLDILAYFVVVVVVAKLKKIFFFFFFNFFSFIVF